MKMYANSASLHRDEKHSTGFIKQRVAVAHEPLVHQKKRTAEYENEYEDDDENDFRGELHDLELFRKNWALFLSLGFRFLIERWLGAGKEIMAIRWQEF